MTMNEPDIKTRHVLEGISKRIRHFRVQQGLSMSALAKKAGFTKSYMSQIENLKREPTIGTLVSIAHALGLDVFTILSGEKSFEEEEGLVIIKKADRREMIIPDMPSDTKFESINHTKKDRLLDGYVLTSGFEFAEEPMPHEGQELLFILEGKQEFIYNGKSYILEKGDCACFDGQIPHYGRSFGKKKSQALVVFPLQSTKS